MSQPFDTKVNGYSKVFWSGITTLELAKVIDDVIRNKVTGLKQISREKLANLIYWRLFNEIFRNNQLQIIENEDYISDKSLVSIRNDYTYNVPSYKEMLNDMKNG